MSDDIKPRPSESWPVIAEDEIEAVAAVLRSGRVNYWTGKENRRFEEEFAGKTQSRHAVALANGTLALELALHAIGLEPGDEVVVPARSFFASAGCVVLMGGRPVFADVDIDTQNVSAETVAAALSPRTRAVICVHLAGHPCDMNPLLDLCRQRGLRLIEDCAQAQGALYRGRPVGSIGDIGCFSFCQDKITTTGGEGGMLVTNEEALWRRAWSFKDHGKSYEAVFRREHPAGFRWYHEDFGSNFRLTEMQAAIGRCQLKKLDEWVRKRRRHARYLYEALHDHSLLRVPFEKEYAWHVFYKFYIFVRKDDLAAGWSRCRLIDEINACGIPCITGSCPEIYREKAFSGGPFAPPRPLVNARELGETSLMLQVHPSLSEETIERHAAILKDVFDQASSTRAGRGGRGTVERSLS